MNKEVKAKWLEALRSGEFEQGRDFLSNQGRFCCLGVLCELAAREGVIHRAIGPDQETAYDGDSFYLPFPVRDWSGIAHFQAEIPSGEGETLAQLNDQGYTFAQIADIIEQEF